MTKNTNAQAGMPVTTKVMCFVIYVLFLSKQSEEACRGQNI